MNHINESHFVTNELTGIKSLNCFKSRRHNTPLCFQINVNSKSSEKHDKYLNNHSHRLLMHFFIDII